MPTEPGYEARRKQESERKRLRVLQAAGACFAERGFKKTTMDAVAKRAGVSKGLVFHFFGNKQAIFSAVIEDGLRQWSTLSEHRASSVEDDPLGELRALFLASFDFVEQHPVLILFARDDEGLGQQYRKQVVLCNKRWRDRAQRIFKRGIRDGVIRDVDARQVATIFHRTQVALLIAESRHGTIPRYDRATIETTLDIFIRGIQRG
ncbi:hypothetical protein A3709_02140 [Halioglobus sp. HI00S01]|uniref:TetR/AcrR family transcriptional regulator n=1 Tax=Halioglobus sp. HI00S01 TaxID=1822214 RepID=UPI0007C3F3B9|nr:TetR/AcrR family transcriptional regulator [Halioglobus sp. HI00S01]KZX58285.1 hypothetical protein A3709_02140 [Halioglobus sp. HI00S01]